MIIDQAGKLRSREIDQKHFEDLLSRAIIEHGLSFSFVEYKWIRELFLYLYPGLRIPSRNTAVSNLWRIHDEEKVKVKNAMRKANSRICLTSDCWTCITQEGYICVTAHFVDSNWKLNSKILAFSKLDPPHGGHEMAKKIFEILLDWGIDRKVFSITLDNASANDTMVNFMKTQFNLQNSLICNGSYFHVRCSAHILNLIVQEGLGVASGALKKIRESIKYVRGSEARKIAFKECVLQVRGIDTKVGLRMDVPTRWNSTYVMLDSAIKYKRAFGCLAIRDRNYVHCPSDDEWNRAARMCEFLKPFFVMTNLISGSTYPTSNRYFMQVWKIEKLLREFVMCEDLVIKEMASKMMTKFSKYWHDYCEILAIGAILDPRMKFGAIQFAYRKIEPSTSEEKISALRKKIYELFEEYEKVKSNESNASTSNVSLLPPQPISYTDDEQVLDTFDEYVDYLSQNVTTNGKSELDLYLEEGNLDPKCHEKLDVLAYWRDRHDRYPNLSRMACDVLSIPITTVASESAFSLGIYKLNFNKNKYTHK
uniref:AC transposase n=1 Tax=Cajanus cajan TaxID=3821 RepID=A0A151U488_CAJCA|nr:Putative AC transposase [Cajanus cajan]